MNPIPEITPDLAPFFDAARRSELAVQRCRGCGAYRFPPRPLCSSCHSTEAEWVTVAGTGEVFSYNVMHQVYHPRFAAEVPYAVVVVKLDEGVKFTSNLVGVPVDQVRIGTRVKAVFEKASDEVTLPKFALVVG